MIHLPADNPNSRKGREQGMILINVLVIVMLATSVLTIMLVAEESHLERSFRLRAAAQAMAYARGGELSAIVALRRDLAAGNTADSLDEPWANINDQSVAIEGGQFTFAVVDAQARFNLNSLIRRDVASRSTLDQVVLAAQLSGDVAERIAILIEFGGPINDLTDLQVIGLDHRELSRLAQFSTALPTPTDVNLNTASEDLIAILLGNPAAARTLVGMRNRTGGLHSASFASASILLPPGGTLTSEYFWSRAKVTMGETSQQLTSLLHRRVVDGTPQVVAMRRWRGTPPVQAPTLN